VATPKVALVVLTWNGIADVLPCLESVRRLDYGNLLVIVADNGSTDGTQAAVRAQFPEVVLVENGQNLGYAEGNNAGIRRALELGADYVMLLNNDTEVDPALVRELVAVGEADPQVGVVGPMIYYHADRERIWCAGARVEWSIAEVILLDKDALDAGTDVQPRDVPFISGCALCAKRAAIERVGLIDPRFFIYYEELDWCERMRRAGFRLVLVPRAKVWHKVSRAFGQASATTTYYMTRNRLLFLHKNLRWPARWRSISVTELAALKTIAVRWLRGQRDDSLARWRALRDYALGRFGQYRYQQSAIGVPRPSPASQSSKLSADR
jgi:GT2 family glycosyltransferase